MVVAVPGVRSIEGTFREPTTDSGRGAVGSVGGRLGAARVGGRERMGTFRVSPVVTSWASEGGRGGLVEADDARRVGGTEGMGRGLRPWFRREGGRVGSFVPAL